MRINFSSFFAGLKKLFQKFFSRTEVGPAVPLATDQAVVQNLNETRWPSLTQFTYLFRYLNRTEGWIFRLALLLLFISAMLLVARYINRHWIPEPAVGGTYTVAVVGAPRFINPILASSEVDTNLTSLFFSGLVRLTPEGKYENDLAEKIEASADSKTFTAWLKPSLSWHDGQSLTSEDVRFTFETIQNPNVGSPQYAKFRDVKIEIPDDKRIIFKLEKADANFIMNLGLGIAPAHIWAEIPAAAMSATEFNLKPVGSGPFMFKEIRKMEKSGDVRGLTLERFAQAATPALLKTLKIRFATDVQAELDLIASGQADGLRLVANDFFSKAVKLRGAKANYQPLPQIVAIFFNFKNKLLAEKNIRLALSAAIDTEEIVKKIRPDARFINGPVLDGMPGGESISSGRKTELETATKLLTDAGWKKDAEFFTKGTAELSLVLTVPDIKEYTDVASLVAEAWQKLGVKVEIRKIDPGALAKDVIKNRNFEALLYADRYDNTLSLFPFWHSTQSFDPGLNLTSYYNKDLDQALTDTQKPNLTPEAKAELNQKIQNLIQKDLPAVFLYQPSALIVNTVNLRSTSPGTLLTANNYFLDATNWYTKTKRFWKWSP
ncbi:ABC transporter substrate-binding protein [Candidatus Parcubacteria bacterium]|nr:MAG: ABC transporter substrate-binding protein [Candidatus Parcubacteria bacterium]